LAATSTMWAWPSASKWVRGWVIGGPVQRRETRAQPWAGPGVR
jgi:hypothetical protein